MCGWRDARWLTALLRTQPAESGEGGCAAVTTVPPSGLHLTSVLLPQSPRGPYSALHVVDVNRPTSLCPAGLAEMDHSDCVRILAWPAQASREAHPLQWAGHLMVGARGEAGKEGNTGCKFLNKKT